MGEAAQALDEHHHGRDAGAGHLRRVVESAARHAVRAAGGLADRLVTEVDELPIEWPRWDPPLHIPEHLESLLGRDPLARRLSLGQHAVERRLVEVTLVEGHLHLCGYRRRDSARRFEHADRRDAAIAQGDLPPLEREAGHARDGIAAHRHRRRANVGSLTSECDDVPLDPEGAENRAQREFETLEHRPLLDVEFEVGGYVAQPVACSERSINVDAVRGQRIGQGDAVAVAQDAELLRLHRAGGATRPPQRSAETETLLVGPVHERHRYRRRTLLADAPQHLECRDNIKAAIQPTSVLDRVEVPAEQHRPTRRAAVGRPEVACFVSPDLDREQSELLEEPLAGAFPSRRPADPLGTVGTARQPVEITQLLDDTPRFERHQIAIQPPSTTSV